MAFSLLRCLTVPRAAYLFLSLLTVTPLCHASDSDSLNFFEKRIRPLLADNCYNCHSTNTNSQGGLRLDDRNALLTGGNRGPAIVPGDAAKSLLLKAVSHDDAKLKMPPKKQLSNEQLADLKKWIEDGAVWPQVEYKLSESNNAAEYSRLRQEHWAWQPLKVGRVPSVKNADWPQDEIDRFLLAKLEEKGLKTSGDADKVTLLRRVSFDLTGLPPLVEVSDSFVKDDSPQAFANLVDRLLESSTFGERWGRHWLDVARYGESSGSSRNIPYPHAWRYRDYVIASFNKDKPYDQFIREQIAGDLLSATSTSEREEQLIATGFLALGVKDVNQRYKVRFIMDNVDEQIDTVTRAFLGVTASCARCHDHKFDPIPTVDYYALAGIFRSTDLCAGVRNKMGGGGLDYYDTKMLLSLSSSNDQDPELTAKLDAANKNLKEAQAEFQKLSDSKEGAELAANGRPKRAVAREKVTKAQAALVSLNDPALRGKVALGVRDSESVADTEIRIRGEAEKLGPVAPRGFLTLFSLDSPAVNTQQSGRLELAQWLTHEKNPLTSRVMVNRIWKHLFGQGLVSTVDNFGVNGDLPSHPELLDHLSQRFIDNGWSVKRLIRTIVLTRAYQLSSDGMKDNLGIDPANRLVWRHTPRRLDAEEIRDSMPAAAGRLTLVPPEGSPAKDFKVVEMRNNGPEARRLMELARASTQRSIYLPLLRGVSPTSLEVFDFAQQGMVTGSRDTTTVAPQALYLLNDPFVRRQAVALAERVLASSESSETVRIDQAFRLTLGRQPTRSEAELAKAYLAEYQSVAQKGFGSKLAEANVAHGDAPTITQNPSAGGNSNAAAVQELNPNQDVRAEEADKEEAIEPKDPVRAAWSSFCQALLGTAEFRYLK